MILILGHIQIQRWKNKLQKINNSRPKLTRTEYVNQLVNSGFDKKHVEVVYDEIRDKDIMESKRLNIPIVIIKMTRLKNENKVDTGFDNERDKYIDDSYSEKTGKKLR